MKAFSRFTLIALLFLFKTFGAYAVTAGFTADVTSGCAPLVVHFTNTSTGATSYFWDFGNTVTSVLKDPSTSYLTPGTYTVKLTATSGSTSVTTTMTITVYPPPTVSFVASDTSVCPGASVTFTSTSSGGVSGPMTYVWDFGDGTLDFSASPTHSYSKDGFYAVTLSVTNSMGCVSTKKVVNYMHIFKPAAPNFSVSSAHFCKAPALAVFTNLTSGTPPISYVWNFGDGSPLSTLVSPSHTYTAAGSYPISLTTKDGNGCMDSVTIPGSVIISNLKASFTFPASACVNDGVLFSNTSSTSRISSSWDFGDGGTSSADSAVHAYTSPGTYSVRLVISDGFCTDTAIHTIKINGGPVATILQSPKDPCPPPVGVTFTSTAPPGTITKWLFGDGSTGTGTPATHTYWRRGVDTIRLIVTDPATGCTDTVKKIDTLYDAIFTIIDTPTSGCRPLKVGFDCSLITFEPDTTIPPSNYPFPIVSYSWDFGDGSPTTTTSKPFHTYGAVGVYTVSLTITTSNGCTFTDTTVIEVGDPPTITASIAPKHICIRDHIDIPITVITGPADDFLWDFGAIGSVESHSPLLHMTFPMPGVFTVTVYASYHGCKSAPLVLTDTMLVDSPKARIVETFICNPRNQVQFYDSSWGDDTHLWIFGDGTTSTLDNPLHTYPALTTYTVTLTTYNARSGCRDTTYLPIDLKPPVFDFTADRTAICRDEIVHITPIVTSGKVYKYFWMVDGVPINDKYHVNQSTFVLTDTFYVTGLHNVTLVVSDQMGCTDTVAKPGYITVAKPVAGFTVTPPSGCRSLLVTFKDKSTDVPGVSLTTFDWTFGDGGTALLYGPTATHTYTANGSYSIKEIVTDALGCKDTAVYSPVVVNHPDASFFASNLFPCSFENDYFTNTSVGAISSMWYFGDGSTSTITSPWHAYSGPGKYTVKLVVTDVFGCTDTAEYKDYITITKPKASFSMTDSFSICPPLTVSFYNTSSGGMAFFWDFGNSSTSTAVYPSTLYTKTGIDTVMLVVMDYNSCTDTAYNYVKIWGYAGAFKYTPLTGCSPLKVHFTSNLTNIPKIIWDFSDGVTSPPTTIDSIDHIYTLPGWYVPKLILSDNTGCEASSQGLDTIKVDAVRSRFTTEPYPVCQGDTMHFKDTAFSYFSYITKWSWTFTNGDTSTLQSPAGYFGTAGYYDIALRVWDAWGCTDSTLQSVYVNPPPIIKADVDTIICVGDAAALHGYGGISYTWAAGPTLSCVACNPAYASPKVVTTYTVTGTDANGCHNTDDVTVYLKTKTVSSSHGDTTVCQGAIVPVFDSGATQFSWLPPAGLSDPHAANPLASPDTTTTYMIIAQLASCIPDTNFLTITIHPVPTVDAGADQTVVEGSQVQLRATGANIFGITWSADGDTSFSCKNCLNPKVIPIKNTTYNIHVTSSFGCPNEDSVHIFVYCDKSQVFIPNTFTPNGDGQNDVFYPRGRGISTVKSFRIFNRWGELLFERKNIDLNDASNAWDGTFQGGDPRPDVYVYFLEAICDAGDPIFIKGDVTLIR